MLYKKPLPIIIFIIIGLAFAYAVTIPWRNFVYRGEMERGDSALADRQYTLALVHYQKASILEFGDDAAENQSHLAKKSAENILELKDFLKEKNQSDLLELIDTADSKTCNLQTDRDLIERGLSQIAKINLEFCAKEGPKNYDSWLFLGIANQKISEDNNIFKELKPSFRQAAADAYAKAYAINPINKSAIEYSVSVNKVIGDQEEVDHWQKILNDLNKIGK